ncbi:MAG: SDR family NAD(P)-dependent oxidoreductase [Alphaproteobacteria bacterium]|nr:SDR family NAD(P)-dependent oxidoreductase [Alphaproteobacteria bacterium]
MTETTLAGRVAIVTGGARGIGAAIARALVDAGASVVVADNGTAIDGNAPDPVVAENAAAQMGPRAAPFTTTLGSPEAATALVRATLDRFGALDIVVNNAAIIRDAFIFKAAPADWDAVIRTNLSAAYYLLGAATPVLRDHAKAGRGGIGDKPVYRWGRIVNIISSAAFYGNYGQTAYGASKGGLFGLTRNVAHDLARAGITCNAVAPFAHTRVTESIVPANDAQAAYKARALTVDPRHVGTLVAYLASEAAQSITGQLFGVRGRDVFLFSQPRPIAHAISTGRDFDPASLARAVEANFAGKFAELVTDLEAFNTDPIV